MRRVLCLLALPCLAAQPQPARAQPKPLEFHLTYDRAVTDWERARYFERI